MLLDDIGVPLDLMRMQPIAQDPPKHDRMKALFQQAFTPRRIAAHTEVIRAIVNHAIDGVAADGECDLVKDIGAHITSRVIGSLLGTPESDDAKLVDWSNIILGYEDPDYRPEFDEVTQVIAEAFEYVLPLIADRRENPTDDLTTALGAAEVDGDHLTEAEMVATFGLLMAAGNDSTRAVYGQSMLALIENPDQRQLLIDDPSRIEDAVEECLRCFPAFSYMRRTATRDTELHGQQIKEGDKLALWYISGNRDETVYENAEAFDLTRPRVQHQAFGAGGRHFCLGAALARLEGAVAIGTLVRRFPDIELAGEPVRRTTFTLRGLEHLPVSIA
jgi:cytochrome P450